MAYGAILGQQPTGGMTAEIVLSIASSNYTGLSTVTPSGTTLNGTVINGFWTITGITEYGDYTVTATGTSPLTIPVTVNTCQQYVVPQINNILNDNSWKQIQFAAQHNIGANYWSIGDGKQIEINGTINNTLFQNKICWVYILGFNHNSAYEGNNRIHFGGFRREQNYTSSNGVALYNHISTTEGTFYMNTSASNRGGWQNSYMRNTIINANATTSTNFSNNSFLGALPSSLQNVLIQCTKYTNNTGGSNSSSSTASSTRDWAFLLSEYEIFGTISRSSASEGNFQEQYQYYKNGNAIIKYDIDAISSAIWWWMRSPYAYDQYDFCVVNGSGNTGYTNANYRYGFAPAFCVG